MPQARAETETVQECLRKLVQLLPQVTRGLRRRHVPAGLREGRLGPRHGVALSLLSERGPLTVGRLAAALGLSLPTVSGIITDVELAGFVERSADPEDRRRTIVTLLPQHGEAITTWLDVTTAPMARALDKLSPDERMTFLKGMTLLEAELNAPVPDRRADRRQARRPRSRMSVRGSRRSGDGSTA